LIWSCPGSERPRAKQPRWHELMWQQATLLEEKQWKQKSRMLGKLVAVTF
jgi:hypothetical protein